MAARGRVHENYVTQYLRHSYFGEPPPKSLDRNAFSAGACGRPATRTAPRTLTAFTAAAIASARAHFPEQPRMWVVCGGGRQEPHADEHDRRQRRKCGGPVRSHRRRRRQPGGGGLGLSGRALAQGAADHVSGHDGRGATTDGRCTGAGERLTHAIPEDISRLLCARRRSRPSACRRMCRLFPSAPRACPRRNGWRSE